MANEKKQSGLDALANSYRKALGNQKPQEYEASGRTARTPSAFSQNVTIAPRMNVMDMAINSLRNRVANSSVGRSMGEWAKNAAETYTNHKQINDWLKNTPEGQQYLADYNKSEEERQKAEEIKRRQDAITLAQDIDVASSLYEPPTKRELVKVKDTNMDNADMFSNDWEPVAGDEHEEWRTVQNERYNPLAREERDALIDSYYKAMMGGVDSETYHQIMVDVAKNGGIQQLVAEQKADAESDRNYSAKLNYGINLDDMSLLQRAGKTAGNLLSGTEKQWLGQQMAGIDVMVTPPEAMSAKAQTETFQADRDRVRDAAWDYVSALVGRRLGGVNEQEVSAARNTLNSAVMGDYYLADETYDPNLEMGDPRNAAWLRVADQLNAVADRIAEGDSSITKDNILDFIQGGNLSEQVEKAFNDDQFQAAYENLLRGGAEDLELAKAYNPIASSFGDMAIDAASSALSSAQSVLLSRMLLGGAISGVSNLQTRVIDKLAKSGAAKFLVNGAGFVGNRIQDILGMAAFGTGAYGASANEARQKMLEQGIDIGLEEARKIKQYAAANTGIEFGSEMLFSSIGAIKNASGSSIFNGFADEFGEALSGFVSTPRGKAVVGTIGKLVGGSVEEGLEEVIGDFVRDVCDVGGLVGDENKTTFEEYLKDFLVGAMSGLMGEVTSTVYAPLQRENVGKQVKAGEATLSDGTKLTVQDMVNLANSEGMEGTTLAKTYNDLFKGLPRSIDSFTNKEVGRLYEAYEETLGKSEEAINRVQDTLDKFESGEELRRSDINKITNNADAVRYLQSAAGTELNLDGSITERRAAVEDALRAIASQNETLREALTENVTPEAENANMDDLEARINALPIMNRQAMPNEIANGYFQDSTRDMVRNAAQQMGIGEEGQNIMAGLYSGNRENAIDYVGEMTKYYNQGKENKAFNVADTEGNQFSNAEQAQAAWMAGRADQLASTAREEISNDREEGLRVRTGSEWQNGQSASGSAGIVEEGTATAQRGQVGSVQREGGNARVSSESLRQNASYAIASTGLRVVTNDSRLANAKKYAEDNGMNFVAWAGGALTIDGEQSRGYYDPETNTVYVRADHQLFTAEQLTIHETTHGRIRNGEIVLGRVDGKEETASLKTVYKTLVKELGGLDKFERVLDAYVEIYAGINISRQGVFEEMICDAMAGMNDFLSVGHFEEALKHAPSLKTAKAVTEENASNGTRAGPKESGGKHSVDKKGNVIDDNFSETKRNQIIKDIENGLYKHKNLTFTLLQNTPQVILENVDKDNRSFVTTASKVWDVMHDHGMDGNDYLNALYSIYNPDYIVYQDSGQNAGHHVAIAAQGNGDIVIAFELSNYRDRSSAVNGEAGFYNVNITAFPSDDGYVEDLLENGYVVYEKTEGKEYEVPDHVALDDTSLGLDANTSNEKLSQTNEYVKDNLETAIDEFGDSGEYNSEAAGSFSRELDPDVLKKLNSGKTMKVYRSMQLIDGKLYPPMAAKIADDSGKRKLVDPTEFNAWYKADEHPELLDENGKFKLDKGKGSPLDVAYNPYWHTSNMMLNDQFSGAYDRPNLVTVECEIPVSELTSGYKAQFAKDAVGLTPWHSGPVASQLGKAGNQRNVYLSRWVKVNRIVSDAEVAKNIAKTLKGTGISVPINTVTPSLRAELEKIGVPISEASGLNKKTSAKLNANVLGNEMYAAAPKSVAAYKYSRVIDTKEFRSWFGNSVVVNTDGSPKVVYHGTNADFTQFRVGDIGYHVGSAEQASDRIRGIDGARVMPLYAKIENPLEIGMDYGDWNARNVAQMMLETEVFEDDPKTERRLQQIIDIDSAKGRESAAQRRNRELRQLLQSLGYDGVVYENSFEGARYTGDNKSYIVFDSAQLKSATGNIGTFDSKNPDIRFSRDIDSVGNSLTESQSEYFKESKIRDEEGNLLVVYHGTDADFTVFDRTKGRSTMDIQGSFFSPWDIDAEGYGPNVKAYYLNIKNPAPEGVAYKALNAHKGQNNAGVLAREDLERMGYDGVNNSNEEYIAFYPEQIKAVDNQAPTNSPDVRFSRDIDAYLQEQHKEYKNDETNRRIAAEGVQDLIEGFERVSAVGGKVDMAERRRDIRTLGNGISAQFVKSGRVNLNGTRIRSAEDLAQVGQIFRNPKFETIRYFYVKKGKIVGTDSVTAKLPGISPAFSEDFQEADLLKKIGRTGADGVYLLHNHPSGDVTPSRQDFGVTGKLAEAIQNNTKAKFMGHVVIDHETYAQIDVDTNKRTASWEQKTIPGQGSFDLLLTPSLENANLGKEVLSPGAVAAVGKDVVNGSGYSAIIYTSSKGYVRQLQEISDKVIKNNKQIGNYIRNQRVNAGAGMAFVYTKDRAVYDALVQVYGDDILTDVVLDGSEYKDMRKNVFQREGMYMGVKEGDISAVHANEGQADFNVTKFSRDLSNTELYEANRQLQKDLTELRSKLKTRTEQYKYWKGQTKVTEGRQLRIDDVTRLAREIIKGQESSADAKAVAEKMKALGEYILNTADENVYDEARLKAYEIAHEILSNAKVLNEQGGEHFYKDFRAALKQTPIYVTPSVREEVSPDGWNGLRQMAKGIFTPTADKSKGKTVDVIYHDLQSTFGEWLLPEYITSEADQLNKIFEVVETYQPVYENINSYDMADATEWTANEILTRIIGEEIRETNPTYADRMEKKLSDQKVKSQEALRRVREQRDRKVQNLKEHYQQVAEDRRNRKIDSEMRTRLLKWARRVNNMKLPRVAGNLRDLMIGDLDTVAKSITGQKLGYLQALEDWYLAEQQNDPNFFQDKEIEAQLKRLHSKHINDLTQEEVADLITILQNFEAEWRHKDTGEMIDSAIKVDRYAAAMNTIDDVANTRGRRRGKGGKADRIAQTVDAFFVDNQLSPTRAMKRITGYHDGDPLSVLTKEVSDGYTKKIAFMMEANRKFDRWLNNKKFCRALMGKHARTITVRGAVGMTVREFHITPAMGIGLYLASMNDDNMRHIAQGGIQIADLERYRKGDLKGAFDTGEIAKFTREAAKAVENQLTDEEKAFAKVVYEYYNIMAPNAINDVSEVVSGYAKARVKNYYPIRVLQTYLDKNAGEIREGGTPGNAGFLNERTTSTKPIVLMDVVDVLRRSIDENSTYVGLEIPIRNFNLLKNTRVSLDDGSLASVQDMIQRKWGDEADKYISKMISDVQGKGKGQSTIFNNLVNVARGNQAKAALHLNAGTGIKQAASLPTAAAVLGTKPIVRSITTLARKVDPALIRKYTPLYDYRALGYSTPEIGDIREKKAELPKALKWIEAIDLWTVRRIWRASEYYVLENNKNLKPYSEEFYKEVKDIWEQTVQETQPNYTPMQRSQSLRSDGVERVVHLFKTQPYQNFNILYDAFAEAHAKRVQMVANTNDETKANYKKAKTGLARAVGSQIVSSFVFALMQYVVDLARGKKKKYQDDDGEDDILAWMKAMGLNMLSNGFGVLPLGSLILEGIENASDMALKAIGKEAFFGQKYYGLSDPTIDAINDAGSYLGSLINKIGNYANGNNSSETFIRNMVDAVSELSALAGIPVGNGLRTLQSITRIVLAGGTKAGLLYDGNMLLAEYNTLRLTTDPAKYKSDYYTLLQKAWRHDEDAYAEIYNKMIEEKGFATESQSAKQNVDANIKKWGYVMLKDAWERDANEFEDLRKKMLNLPGDPFATGTKTSAENIDANVNDWIKEKTQQSEAKQTFYGIVYDEMTANSLWDKAPDAAKDKALEKLLSLALEMGVEGSDKNGAKYKADIEGGKSIGLDATEYMLYQVALQMSDADGNGTIKQSEAEAAVKMLSGLSAEEKAYLFQTTNKGWKNNPFK